MMKKGATSAVLAVAVLSASVAAQSAPCILKDKECSATMACCGPEVCVEKNANFAQCRPMSDLSDPDQVEELADWSKNILPAPSMGFVSTGDVEDDDNYMDDIEDDEDEDDEEYDMSDDSMGMGETSMGMGMGETGMSMGMGEDSMGEDSYMDDEEDAGSGPPDEDDMDDEEDMGEEEMGEYDDDEDDDEDDSLISEIPTGPVEDAPDLVIMDEADEDSSSTSMAAATTGDAGMGTEQVGEEPEALADDDEDEDDDDDEDKEDEEEVEIMNEDLENDMGEMGAMTEDADVVVVPEVTYMTFEGSDYIANGANLVAVMDLNVTGVDGSMNVTTAEECEAMCTATVGCNAATFYLNVTLAEGNDTCVLKTIADVCELPEDALEDDNAILLLQVDPECEDDMASDLDMDDLDMEDSASANGTNSTFSDSDRSLGDSEDDSTTNVATTSSAVSVRGAMIAMAVAGAAAFF